MSRALSTVLLVVLVLHVLLKPAAAAPPGEILNLGVTQEGEARGKARALARELEVFLTRELADHLRRSGAMAKLAAAEDRGCRDQGCMDRLVKRSGAIALLGVDLQGNGANDYYVRTWLYEAERHEVLAEEKSCSPCDRGQLADAINATAGGLLVRRSAPVGAEAPPRPPVPKATAVEEKPVPVAMGKTEREDRTAKRGCHLRSKCRIALDVAVGALAVGGLATMGTMLGYNGQPTSGPCLDGSGKVYSDGCIWNFYKRGMIPGFGAAGAVAAVGLILSVTIP